MKILSLPGILLLLTFHVIMTTPALGQEDQPIDAALSLGISYYQEGHPAKALSYFKKQIQFNDAADTTLSTFQEKMERLYWMANCHEIMGNLDTATQYYQLIIEKEEQKGQIYKSYEAMLILADLDVDEGKIDQALPVYERLYNAYAGNPRRQTDVLNSLGIVYKRKGDYAKALDYFEQVLKGRINQFGPDHSFVTQARINIGVVHIHMGNQFKGIEFYEKVLTDTEGKNFPYRLIVMGNLADVYREEGEFRKGIRLLHKGIQIAIEQFNDSHIETGYLLLGLGKTYLDMGEVDSAYHILSQNKKIFEENYRDDVQYGFLTLSTVAHSATRAGKFQEALHSLDQAQDIVDSISGGNDPLQLKIYNIRSDVYKEMGNHQGALVQLEKSISLLKNQKGGHLPQNLSAKAKVYSKTADFIFKTSHSLTQLLHADSLFDEAISVSTQLRNTYSNPESQLSHQEKYVNLFSNGASLSVELARITSDETYLYTAFERVEKGKASLLAQAIKKSGAIHFSGMPKNIIANEKQLKIELTYYEEAIFEESQKEKGGNAQLLKKWKDKRFFLNQEYDSLQVSIQENFPDYLTFKSSDNVATVKQIQKALSEDNGLIEFTICDSQVLAFLITRDKFQVHSLPMVYLEDIDSLRLGLQGYHTQSLRGKFRTWYDALFRKKAWQLYQTLLAPMESDLPSKLIIVTDNYLGYIPFETFLTEKTGENIPYRDYPFLLQKKQISYAYSASFFHFFQTQSKPKTSLEPMLAIAPDFNQEQGPQFATAKLRRGAFAPLTHNTEEVNFISSLWGGTAKIGNQALKSDFIRQAPAHKIIHIASHAVVNDQYPNYSFIAFASNDSTQDPLLYLSEIYNLELEADMVVLSACNSGVGRLYKGEGIASLARGFTYAGSKSLITTLWSVNDNYTEELMKAFYQHLKEGKPKDEALREAKLTLLEGQNLSPFYWAAPIAIGDMRPLSQTKFHTGLKYGVIVGMVLLLLILFRLRRIRNKKNRGATWESDHGNA